jgi:thioredoxin 1
MTRPHSPPLKPRKTVLIAAHANWCPTCRTQQPTLASLIDDEAFAGCVAFRVNFDEDKGFLKEHRVRFQSTLFSFQRT